MCILVPVGVVQVTIVWQIAMWVIPNTECDMWAKAGVRVMEDRQNIEITR